MNRYEPRTPRALAGFAAVFMTAATLAVAVLAPAAMDAGSRDGGILTMSTEPQSHAVVNSGPLTTSIDVVAYRAPRRLPAAVQTRAQGRAGVAS